MQEKTETLTIREVNMPLSSKDRANGKKVNTWRGSIRYINRDDIFFTSTYGTFTKIYQ